MPLDRLAPDQRAVVQLVLQQGRSYDDLANLLGISEDAVRDRAHAGVAALTDVPAPARAGDIADYLLGQQTAPERESTHDVLTGDPAARGWAVAVAGELTDVARDLPEIPAAAGTPVVEPVEPAEPAAPDEPVVPVTEDASALEPLERPRPRPRPLREDRTRRARVDDREAAVAGGPVRERTSSRLGGALLIGGLAILVAAILILVVNGGGDDDPETAANGTTTGEATPESTATPEPLGQIGLEAVEGQTGRGIMALFNQEDQGIVFTLAAERVPALEEGEAYAMWLTRDDGRAQLLGFFQEAPQGDRRQLATTGPRESDQARFARWFATYDHIVVSKETVNRPSEPSEIVLQGDLPAAGDE